jgi:hypothetical protein
MGALFKCLSGACRCAFVRVRSVPRGQWLTTGVSNGNRLIALPPSLSPTSHPSIPGANGVDTLTEPPSSDYAVRMRLIRGVIRRESQTASRAVFATHIG